LAYKIVNILLKHLLLRKDLILPIFLLLQEMRLLYKRKLIVLLRLLLLVVYLSFRTELLGSLAQWLTQLSAKEFISSLSLGSPFALRAVLETGYNTFYLPPNSLAWGALTGVCFGLCPDWTQLQERLSAPCQLQERNFVIQIRLFVLYTRTETVTRILYEELDRTSKPDPALPT